MKRDPEVENCNGKTLEETSTNSKQYETMAGHVEIQKNPVCKVIKMTKVCEKWIKMNFSIVVYTWRLYQYARNGTSARKW